MTPPALGAALPALDPRRVGVPSPEGDRHLRVVPDRASRSVRRHRALALLTAGLVCAGLFAVVVFHVLMSQNQLEVDHLGGQVAVAQESEQRLRLRIAELESPERVVNIARQRLGMVPVKAVTVLSDPHGRPVTGGRPQDGQPPTPGRQ